MGKTNKHINKKVVDTTKHAKSQVLEKEVPSSRLSTSLCCVCLSIFALSFGLLNSYHEYSMFENDRHFSHLSSLEREMTFRTEMGLYFSFYKTIVEAPSYTAGLGILLSYNLTEYPNTINAIGKYNVFPEIVLGLSFRAFQSITNFFKIKTKECWVVDRGDDLDEIESCEGIGDMHFFYVMGVFAWNSTVAILIFAYGYFLSDSVLGGIISTCSFFYNHGESTRVQWTPPLRESFGYPFCLSGLLFVSLSLKYPVHRKLWICLIALSSIGFLTTWQFAQFPLLFQSASVFGLNFIGLISIDHLKTVLLGQIIGLIGGFIMLFGNPLLLTSFYTSFLLIAFMCTLEKYLFKESKFFKVIQLLCLIGGTILTKLVLVTVLRVEDDNHIWNLLRSKFTGYKDFHTLLYTCAVEFDFLDLETPINLSLTLLLPVVLFIVGLVLTKLFYEWWTHRLKQSDNAEILFLIIQTTAFAAMAILFMRLKLLLTPNLCILASLVASRKIFSFISKPVWHTASAILILSLMSVNGVKNLNSQHEIIGEYSNPGLEELILWVNETTPISSVFAGPMPTMANLMLSARRPIVNNPFYEDSEMRERTLKVYSLYSRQEPKQVHRVLNSLGVNYAVIVRPYCYTKNKAGCAMIDLWDVEDPSNSHREQLCQRLMVNPHPFNIVFRNDEYAVLRV